MNKTLVLSINSSWNIVNFRSGLIRSLIKDGYNIVVLSPDDGHVDAVRELGADWHALPVKGSSLSPVGDMLLLARYLRLLREIRPAAFLGWTIKPNVYGSLAARLLGIPAINNVSGLGTAFISSGRVLRTLVRGLYRLAFQRSATVFFQNPDDRAEFIEGGLVPAGRSALLPGSGIDLSRFSAVAPSGRDGGRLRFLLVARLLRDKGIYEYVEAARLARRTSPGLRFELLGSLDADNRTAVGRGEVEAWVAEGVIDYLGHVADVRPIMAEADCVVLPSYREGVPRTLIEAAALAKPLVATDVPGCREIARAGTNALTCPPRDAGALAEAMLTMAQFAPERRAAMGAASRALVETEFDEAIVASRYREALDRAVGSRRG